MRGWGKMGLASRRVIAVVELGNENLRQLGLLASRWPIGIMSAALGSRGTLEI